MSGYVDPGDVVTLLKRLQSAGKGIAGVMVWDLGWDATNNWHFAETVGPPDSECIMMILKCIAYNPVQWCRWIL